MKRRNLALVIVLIAVALTLFAVPGSAQAPAKKQPPAQAQQQEQETPYTEEEYDAYEKATQEADLDKRATMLFAFIEKYPKSTLMVYINQGVQTLMAEHYKAEKWDKLLTVAEAWGKTHADDIQTWAYITEAAKHLGQDQKFLLYAEKIYAQKPSANLAASFYETYKKAKDEPKELEWAEKMFAYPEFAGAYSLRMQFVQKHLDAKNFEKAAHYADLTLKSLAVAKKADSVSDADWAKENRAIKKVCNYAIALNLYAKEKYGEAIRVFDNVNKIEKFDFAYYYIGHSLWKMERIEEAIDSFAKAVVLEGPAAAQARPNLEKLYKAIHNDSTVGIDKVYRRAKTELSQ